MHGCCCSSSSFYIASRTPPAASLADENSLHSTHRSSNPAKSPPAPRRLSRSRPRNDQRLKKPTGLTEQPTIIQIERAIGTGVFRDNDPLEFEERRSVFDGIIPGSSRRFETAVERKLRETGEWLVSKSERRSNSSGKRILVAMFLWVLPTWILLLLVTSGIVKPPFDIPLLNDLIT